MLNLPETPREIFERDPGEYLNTLRIVADDYELDEEENALGAWVVRAAGGLSEDLHAVFHAGYIAGLWEELGANSSDIEIGIFRQLRENELDRYDAMDMPVELADEVYAVLAIRPQLEKFGRPGDSQMTARLDWLFEHGVMPMYEEGHRPKGKLLESVRLYFDLGVACAIYQEWNVAMVERGVFGDDRFAGEVEFLQSEPDPLGDLPLPFETQNGCQLTRGDMLGYVLYCEGSLGRSHELNFMAEGATARVVAMTKTGKRGTRPETVPLPRHVDALRELGFKEMAEPTGSATDSQLRRLERALVAPGGVAERTNAAVSKTVIRR